MKKIYDCFYFFDELDLLEIRFEVLNDVVDYFVLSEANESFAGKPKKLLFKENYDRYAKWHHKIIYNNPPEYMTDNYLFSKALISPNTGNKEDVWLREFYQKESIHYSLSSCQNEDVIFISDLDEIWNPDLLITCEDDIVYRPIQECRPFYLNMSSDLHIDCWTGTRFCNYSTYKKYGPNHIRTEREIAGVKINNGGWHFTWLNKKQNKWEDEHPDNYVRLNNIKNSNIRIDEDSLPTYIINYKEKYKNLWYFQK